MRVSPEIIKTAIAKQQEIARRVITEGRPVVGIIAGLDIAYSSTGDTNVAAAAIFNYPDMELLDMRHAAGIVKFPYIPGLLSFREVDLLAELISPFVSGIDVIMVDGQGLAHPRRCGLACHLGVILNIPTIGCAKSRLVGEFEGPGPEKGARSALLHKGERIGTVLRTKDKVRPVFVSIGHKIDLQTAEGVVLNCSRGYRIPEPTRRADIEVSRLRREDK